MVTYPQLKVSVMFILYKTVSQQCDFFLVFVLIIRLHISLLL